MKNRFKLFGIITLLAVIGFTMTVCSKSGGSGGGGKSFNSAEELKVYLDKQPVNSQDKPIKVSMTINDPMLGNVADVIKSSGKYVSLNITGSALTTIPEYAFKDCISLVSITIPASVTKIGGDNWNKRGAFNGCDSLTSVTFQGPVDFSDYSFPRNLRTDYKDTGGGPGTYTWASDSLTWTKQ